MKKYILFVFGLTNEQLVIETLADLEKVSDEIKYFNGPTYSIFHFESEDSAKSIKDILKEYLDGMMESFYIFGLEGDYAIEMDEKLKAYFLDVKFSETLEKEIKSMKEYKGKKDIGIIPIKELLEAYLSTLPEKKLTVNIILDKILEKGIESLTDREKNFLDNQRRIKNGDK